jgi:cytochrome c oxidase cbb3-type subunit 3
MATENKDREVDAFTGTATTGHTWDGIKELDTPLPRWWLWLFYASIAVALVYMVLMPAWPLPNGYTKGVLGFSDRKNVIADIAALEAARGPAFARLQAASYEQIVADPELAEFARAAGEAAFGDNCRTCHGAGGAGAPGYPNLADDEWLWGGTLNDIERTLVVGIRSTHSETRFSLMPSYGRDGLLTAKEIDDVTEHVLTLSPIGASLNANAAAAARGAVTFQAQCASCHRADGSGDRLQGAPSLKDEVWLTGPTREAIRDQIFHGRNRVMPTWETRLQPTTIRALAVYVYGLGGGEAAPPLPAPIDAAAAAAPNETLAPGAAAPAAPAVSP